MMSSSLLLVKLGRFSAKTLAQGQARGKQEPRSVECTEHRELTKARKLRNIRPLSMPATGRKRNPVSADKQALMSAI